MTTASLPLATTDRSFFHRVFRAGATVWVLDGIAATLFSTWVRGTFAFGALWRGVARSVLGDAAKTGGAGAAALGLVIHACVAFSWTTLYAFIYEQSGWLRTLTRTPGGRILAGAVYGAIIQVMMSRVIVPMTLIGPAAPISRNWFIMLFIHMTVVGQPMVWIVRRP